MLTAATVFTSIYLEGLGIAVLYSAFCSNMVQFPTVMADIVMYVLTDPVLHVIIPADIFFISTGLSFFMILELYIAGILKVIG